MDDKFVPPFVVPLSSNKPKPLSLCPNDPGSRYKTRQLQIQVVGKSKMIKTVLVNILEVAKDCQMPPSYPGIFMGYEIGAQAKFDPKKPERQQAFLSGEHDPKDLSRIFVKFITEVVLCPNCNLPEIAINTDTKKVCGQCRACGANDELQITNEKFKRYVINHPPAAHKGDFSKKPGVAAPPPPSNGSGTSTPPKKEKKKKAEKDDDEEQETDDNDGVVWFSDTSAEAAKKRREAMLPESMLEKGAVQEPVPKKETDSDRLKQFLKDANTVEKCKEFKDANNLSDEAFVLVLFEALFPAESDIISLVEANQQFIKQFITPSAATQIGLLKCIENFCSKVNPSVMEKASFIVKKFYDDELFEEENIHAWFNASTVPAVKEKVSPFIKWLKEAEEESGEEEDEEDDN